METLVPFPDADRVPDASLQEARHAAYTSARPDVVAMVPARAMQILDVGCSNGELGSFLRSAVPGRQVVGIEGDTGLATDALVRLDRVVHVDLNGFDWEAAFPADTFDCIIFADVLEHLIDPQRHLRAARRLLKPGGSVVISLPNIRHVSALCSIFIVGRFPRRDRGIFDQTHLRWFTIRDARRLVADAGMTIDATSYSLRLFDRGGGTINKAVCKLLDPIQGWGPIRELLAYQFCIRAVTAQSLGTCGDSP